MDITKQIKLYNKMIIRNKLNINSKHIIITTKTITIMYRTIIVHIVIDNCIEMI